MKYRYKRVVIKTIKDIIKAEKYKANGWKIIEQSMFAMLFEKEV